MHCDVGARLVNKLGVPVYMTQFFSTGKKKRLPDELDMFTDDGKKDESGGGMAFVGLALVRGGLTGHDDRMA